MIGNATHRVNSGTHDRIVGADSAHQFSGDKKAWPVYITIGNILSQMRNSPVKMPILLVGFLPVPSRFTGPSGRADEAQWYRNADALRTVFDLVLVA